MLQLDTVVQANEAGVRRPDDGLRQDIGALQRGLLLLELMQQAARPLTLTELSDMAGLHTSTIHRLLQTLLQTEHVFRDTGKRYYAGPKAYMPLSMDHPFNLLRRDAYDTLRTLRDRFDVTCALNLFIGAERLVLDLANAGDSLSPYYQTHLKSPLHAAASGKLLLLNFPPKLRAEMLGPSPYPRFTSRTITDPEALRLELECTVERGYAVAWNENFEGISAVAGPIVPNGARALGAITLAGPSRYFAPEILPEMGMATRRAADLLAFGSQGTRAVLRMMAF
ncbi:MAG: helix-turn-helix domain-containing protein [Rhodospirillales bacterium]|nr:helix-turn-helix domain-containing protein [Rhodospirillales bacterium]